MDCPRCGFRQPPDAFCANCGVDIKRALLRRRLRSSAITAIFISALVAGGLIVIYSREKAPTIEGAASTPPLETKTQRALVLPKVKETKQKSPAKAIPKDKGQQVEGSGHRSMDSDVKGKGQPSAITPGGTTPRDTGKAPVFTPAPGSDETLKEQINKWVALEWFEKGQAISDGSEAELMMYDRALEADNTFAPAHYYKGIILWQWGQYDQARESFLEFLRFATPQQRALYPLPEEVNAKGSSTTEEDRP